VIIRVCLAVALLTPPAAMAQGNPGPYGKLFGRTAATSADQEHTTLEARSSIGANYDDALLAPEGSPADTPLQRGVQAAGSAFMNLSHHSSIFTANLTGGASRGEYFTQPSSYGTTQYSAAAQLNAKLSTRFEAGAAASYIHSPSYQLFQGLGGGPVDQANANTVNVVLPYSGYAARMLENDSLLASANLTTHITTKSSFQLWASQNQTRFAEEPENDVVVSSYRGIWQWQMQRGLGVHAGFGQEHVDQRASERSDYDSILIDVGVDFNRAFSVARRTTLGFSTSTSYIKHADSGDGEFQFLGGVSLSKFFRRTWQAGVQAYRRSNFVPGFAEPLYTNTVNAFLGGMISTRLEFGAFVSAGSGQTIFSDLSGLGSYTATSQLSYALGRNVGIYGSYFTYWYEAPADALTLSVPGAG